MMNALTAANGESAGWIRDRACGDGDGDGGERCPDDHSGRYGHRTQRQLYERRRLFVSDALN
jgi:hypothetical protein